MNLKKITSKKGLQLSQAFGAVLTLVLVSVLVIVAIVIFVQLADGFTGTSSVTVTNEDDAFLNVSGYTLKAEGNCSFVTTTTLIGIWNATTGVVIPTANYTLTTAGLLTNATVLSVPIPSLNISYNYTWGSEACTTSDEMVDEFANYTSLIGLVGTIIFLGLVIGILVAAFAFGRKEV